MSLKIATWNVNSIKARGDIVALWLKDNPVDILCMQELKCETEVFPHDLFKPLGYHAHVHGQKTYNGVATLIKNDNIPYQIPDFHDESRIIINTYKNIDIINIYAPNGNPVGTEKYEKKLFWYKELLKILESNIMAERDTILLGDFNIIPTELDAASPHGWVNDALYLPEIKDIYRNIINLGFTDAWRALHPNTVDYSFWDYQAGAWPRNNGIRIDHILPSPRLVDKLTSCAVDKTPRGWDKPSDHTPVIVDLDL